MEDNPEKKIENRSQWPIKIQSPVSGCIFWLPSDEACAGSLVWGLDKASYNHPVLVLTTNHKQETATVLILTSLGGRSLYEKFPDNPYFRHHHFPIFPCDSHPDHGNLLFLDGGLQLRKDTYIKTEFRYQVEWELLRHYDKSGREYKLHSVSYRDLMTHLHTPYIKPSPPPSSPCIPVQTTGPTESDLADEPELDKVNFTQADRHLDYSWQRITNNSIGILGSSYHALDFWTKIVIHGSRSLEYDISSNSSRLAPRMVKDCIFA